LAVEVTASELRVELMFPADDDSERFFRELSSEEASVDALVAVDGPSSRR
jgi:hypothetical protein